MGFNNFSLKFSFFLNRGFFLYHLAKIIQLLLSLLDSIQCSFFRFYEASWLLGFSLFLGLLNSYHSEIFISSLYTPVFFYFLYPISSSSCHLLKCVIISNYVREDVCDVKYICFCVKDLTM